MYIILIVSVASGSLGAGAPGGKIITRHFIESLRQIQRGDADLVDVTQSVAWTVQLLQEFFVAQAFFQRFVSKAAVAGKEKPFPVR